MVEKKEKIYDSEFQYRVETVLDRSIQNSL